jgi:hypothetical protein
VTGHGVEAASHRRRPTKSGRRVDVRGTKPRELRRASFGVSNLGDDAGVVGAASLWRALMITGRP